MLKCAARKIRDAYAYIVQNWTEGDEIFLFGFSRGAYTARKVAGLIVSFDNTSVSLIVAGSHGRVGFQGYGQILSVLVRSAWIMQPDTEELRRYALETGRGELPPRPRKPVPIQYAISSMLCR